LDLQSQTGNYQKLLVIGHWLTGILQAWDTPRVLEREYNTDRPSPALQLRALLREAGFTRVHDDAVIAQPAWIRGQQAMHDPCTRCTTRFLASFAPSHFWGQLDTIVPRPCIWHATGEGCPFIACFLSLTTFSKSDHNRFVHLTPGIYRDASLQANRLEGLALEGLALEGLMSANVV
jgi:hypothetical protein